MKFDADLYDSLLSINEEGPSFLLTLITEKVRGRMTVQPYNSYEEARALAMKHHDDFRRLLKSAASGQGKVITDIKSQKSFDSKVSGRAKSKAPNKIKDVLRGSIIVPDDRALEQTVKRLGKMAIINDIDRKSVAKDEFGYYGPWHIDIEIGEGDETIIAEVIIMTARAMAAKHESHGIYDQLRGKDGDVPYAKRMELTAQSRKLWQDANRPNPRDRSDLRRKRNKRLGNQEALRRAFGDPDAF